MFDIGWPELLVIAIVLIVVVGPKDLPPMIRAFGKTTSKLRAMAAEFRGQFDEALREADLEDVKKTIDEARRLNPLQSVRDAVNPLKATGDSIRADLEKSVKNTAAPVMPETKVDVPEPAMKLSSEPPVVAKPAEPKVASGEVTSKKAASEPAAKAKATSAAKPKTTAKRAATAKPAAKPAVRRKKADDGEGAA